MFKRIFAFFILFLPPFVVLHAQVNVSSSGGTSLATYANLRIAFDRINAGVHTGSIVVNIVNNTSETATAVLNAKDSGAANYTSIVIQPQGGATRTVSGSIAGPLIDLNGADNVTIDGQNSGNNKLTISNTSTAITASTIHFRSDATRNTITRCTLLGSSGSSNSTLSGVVNFGTGSVTGNDDNTINLCNIGPAGSNFPINGIYALGTSASINNSGIAITNNNIYDYFHTSEPSNGISINSGNSGWNITGNSFYQTALRSYTDGTSRNAILVSGGSGYAINSNVIGGSAPLASGAAYAMGGLAATQFAAINISVDTTTTDITNIQGNRITNFSLVTASSGASPFGAFCGIRARGGNLNIGTISGNLIGSASGVGNINITSRGDIAVGIYIQFSNELNIRNNTIGAISIIGNDAATGTGITGISSTGGKSFIDISNNTIGNDATNNLRSGTLGFTTGNSVVHGIRLGNSSAMTLVNGNVIRNLASYGTGTSGTVRGITSSPTGIGTGWIISSNVITNLTTNSSFADFNMGEASAIGIRYNSSRGSTISNNQISHVSNINNVAISNIIVAGIVSMSAVQTSDGETRITHNRIWGLNNTSPGSSPISPPIAVGIAIPQGTSTFNVSNNMISIGEGVSSAASFLGIWISNVNRIPAPQLVKVYFNSVRIAGTASSGNLPSFCFLRSNYIWTRDIRVPVDVRNNILENARTGGTGSHYAISNGFNATSVSAVGWPANASDFNVLNANPATIGHWTTALSFNGWKNNSESDNNSFTGIPISFVNPSIADLHTNYGATPTALESGGITIPDLLIDFDNETRPGPTNSVNGGAKNPDIGADEFDGIFLDIVPPTIRFSPLSFTCDGSQRTLIANIVDTSGVPTSGPGGPTLYWRRNNLPFTSVPAVYLGNNNFQFTFGGGANLGDSISYYIVAQDNASTPNVVSSAPGGVVGYSINPPATNTPPTSPSSYFITNLLPTGTYTVGTGGDYPTLTAAINDFNKRCLDGPVVFELINNSYNESGQMTILRHPNVSSTNSLVIRPRLSGVTTVSGSVANSVVLTVLCDHVTIDGSRNGTTSRNLQIVNASPTNPSCLGIGHMSGAPLNHVTIKNCVITPAGFGGYGILLSNWPNLANPGAFNNVSIENNEIQRSTIGISAIVIPDSLTNSNLRIAGNTLNAIGALSNRHIGIMVRGVNGATVTDNQIGNFNNQSDVFHHGIWLSQGTRNSVVTRNTVSNMGNALVSFATGPTGIKIGPQLANANILVSDNIVSDIYSNSGASSGILIDSVASDIRIVKNVISRISNLNPNATRAHGISLESFDGQTGGVIDVSNNFIKSVWARGSTLTANFNNGFGIAIISGNRYQINHNTVILDSNQVSPNSAPAALHVRNVLPGAIQFRNNLLVNNQTAGSIQRYCIFSHSEASAFTAIDHNNYVSTTGPNLGYLGINLKGLSEMQAGFGGNTNSVSIPPIFISPNDFRLKPDANILLDNKGTHIPFVSLDFDGQTRSTTTPDIGADEFIYIGTCANTSVKFAANVTGNTYRWQIDNGSGFTDLNNSSLYSGVTTDTLFINTPPPSLNGSRFRCVIGGGLFGPTYTYKVGNIWTGTTSSNWFEPGNWSCSVVPDSFTNVLINSGAPNSPILNASTQINSLYLNPGTSVTVSSGFTLQILQN